MRATHPVGVHTGCARQREQMGEVAVLTAISGSKKLKR
jgi:hypothetical protein